MTFTAIAVTMLVAAALLVGILIRRDMRRLDATHADYRRASLDLMNRLDDIRPGSGAPRRFDA